MSEQRKRGGWSNPASAVNGAQGGRLPTHFRLSRPAVIYLRELTRARLGRREVTREEMSETLETAFMEWGRQQTHEDPPDTD